ncbi:MAG: hypothetical protein HPY84_03905 [Syntrophobacteraceae bacterium]|nr:hypothetical protein [Syntrophobacteraceae bacterium]
MLFKHPLFFTHPLFFAHPLFFTHPVRFKQQIDGSTTSSVAQTQTAPSFPPRLHRPSREK